jgi:hypothetical protein
MASSTLDRAVPAFGSVTAEQSALAKERQSALAGPNARLVACMARSGISEFVPPETLDSKSASFAAALEVQGLSIPKVAPLYEACADLTVRRAAQEIDGRLVVDLLATLDPSDRKDVAMRLAS